MTRRLRRSIATGVCAAVVAAAATVSLLTPAARVSSADRNGDGRPDSWRTYDQHGRLSEVSVDTNFDGRVDEQEFYDRGSLVRRESDRNFNDRIDLVQEFDPATSKPIRSTVDVDDDGVADLLVLFHDGRPVFSKWTRPRQPLVGAGLLASTRSSYVSRRGLAAMRDPFLDDVSVRDVRLPAAVRGTAGLFESSAFPAPGVLYSPLARTAAIEEWRTSHPASAVTLLFSPRGPPAASLPA
jgi:hypothetical protein